MQLKQHLAGLTSIVAILATSAVVAPAAQADAHRASVRSVIVPATARTGITTHNVRSQGVLRSDADGAADASATPPYRGDTDPDGLPTPFVEGDEGPSAGRAGRTTA